MTDFRPHLVALSLCLAAGGVLGNDDKPTKIFVCIDAKGRRLTSDRPIMECLDREQKQYGTGGTVRATLPPSMTADERAEADAKERREQEERQRQAVVRRRDRVLINRYADEASHQRERAAAVGQLDQSIASGDRRLEDLLRQREDLQAEADKAGGDVIKSQRLKRALDENEANQAAQRRLLSSQRDERLRISVRFDEELARLKELWAQQATRPAKPASRSNS